MNYEQLKARIRKYKLNATKEKTGLFEIPSDLSPQDRTELVAFLNVALACFLCDLAGKPIPDDLTDFIMGAKDEARST